MAAGTTLTLAWRNLGRNRRRAALALAAIAIGQFAFLAVTALIHGHVETVFDSVTGPLVGHVQIHAPGWRAERALDRTLGDLDATLAEIRRCPQVASAMPRLYAPAMAAVGEDGFRGVILGLDDDRERGPRGLLGSAPGLPALGDHRVFVGGGFARAHAIEPGEVLALVAQDADGSIASDLYTVAAVLPSPLELVHTQGILMALADAQELLCLPRQAHEIIVHAPERGGAEAAARHLAALPALAAAEVLPWREVVPHLITMVKVLDLYLLIVLAVLLVAAGAGIANTMLMATFERMREFGMLLSLGCRPGRLVRLIVIEAVALGQMGALLGSALGAGFVAWTAHRGVDYALLGGRAGPYENGFHGLQLSSVLFPRLSPADAIVGAAAVLLISVLAVLWPAAHLLRLEPVEALRG